MLLDVTLCTLAFVVDVEAWVGIDLHEPGVELLIYENVQSQDLKAARVFIVIWRNEAVICVLEIGLKSDNSLCGELFNLLLEDGDIFAAHFEFLVEVGEELLACIRVQVCVVLPGDLELFRLLVQTVVSQMHVQILHV